MKALLLSLGLFLSVASSNAAFLPMSLERKVHVADLIVRGTVISVTRLIPERNVKGMDGSDGWYIGAHSMAVVKVEEAWKFGAGAKGPNFWAREKGKNVMPAFILVPCDYAYDESPSELTEKTSYVLFLSDMGSNIYHPLDPSCTHVIHEGRVADFGMDHPPGEKWTTKSKPLKEFRAAVETAKSTQPKTGEQDGARQPTTAPESKSEGNEKPKPESEWRSQ